MEADPGNSLIQQLKEFEDDVRYQEFAQLDDEEFSYIRGKIPILLSAPHGAKHWRYDKRKGVDGPKEEDEFTAGMSCLIGKLTDAYVIYARRQSNTDPNWYPKIPYKEKLRQIVRDQKIQFVLDIHGAKSDSNFGIALGTMNDISCKAEQDKIIKVLGNQGFRVNTSDKLSKLAINPPAYTGSGDILNGQQTIIRFVSHDLLISAAQFELNAHLRIPKRRSDATVTEAFIGDPNRITQTINALVAVVRMLSQQEE
jgi:hypothetical protein